MLVRFISCATISTSPFLGVSSEEAEMRKATTWLLGIILAQATCSASLADTIKGGVQQSETVNTGLQGGADAYPSYPVPQMVPEQAHSAPPPVHHNLNGNAQQQQRPPMQTQVQDQHTLPQGFLGRWNVQGQRTKVEAITPEFQQNAEMAFQMNTSNVWNINGSPGSYTMSNGEMSTQIWVDKVEGGTAFIRYQHQIKNTMAQEAIVMSLTPNGMQFNGLERISIVKEGLPQPRCKVTYQLSGRRR
jgi:hypothetical protein